MSLVSNRGINPESDADFLVRLQRLGADWRYSDEFLGLVVRTRYPRNYDDLRHDACGCEKCHPELHATPWEAGGV